LEEAIAEIEDCLQADYGMSKRAIALLLLQGDKEIEGLVEAKEGERVADAVRRIVREVKSGGERSPLYRITTARQRLSEYIASKVVERSAPKPKTFSDRLNDWLIHPVWGSLFLGIL
jgi:Fe2+ transport system protein B